MPYHRRMHVTRVRISGFRGIGTADIVLSDRTVLVGPTSAGKSTIIDALSLVLGRERMVRDLTEHDFFGSTPAEATRLKIIATISGFQPDDPAHHPNWFKDRRGIPKWWSLSRHSTQAARDTEHTALAVEIAFAARFATEELRVDHRRYFHDSDDDIDPFAGDEGANPVPSSLLGEIGYYVVPAHRTRERIFSFGSDIFRRLIVSENAIPSNELLSERDRLRSPEAKIEQSGGMKAIVERINAEFSRLLPSKPSFELRVTSTDSESLLNSLVPHYRYQSDAALPAQRHGSGLVSLQTLILLLEFGRSRRESGSNFILAIEEPELHLPPGMQRRVVHRARRAATQTIITTHSPRVAAFYDASELLVLEKHQGRLTASSLLDKPLDHTASNAMRKLLTDSRTQVVEALLHDFIAVPEGRFDFEVLRLLVDAFELGETADLPDAADFGALVGIIPTHDAAIVDTLILIGRVRSDVFAIVDGDAAGDEYVKTLLKLQSPPPLIVQWSDGMDIEDVLAWVAAPVIGDKLEDLVSAMPETDYEIGTAEDFIAALHRKTNEKPAGFKNNLLAYETIVSSIRTEPRSMLRLREFFTALVSAVRAEAHAMLVDDPRSTERVRVVKWKHAVTSDRRGSGSGKDDRSDDGGR